MADQTTTSLERVPSTLLPLPPKARAFVDVVSQRWNALQPRKRTMLIGTLFIIAGISALMMWWSSRTDWRVLFNGLGSRDLQQVEQQLGSAGISYQLTADGGGLQVPAEQLDKARMAIATKGMPSSGRLGFELFDKPNWVGSEFDERVNYQRALEGELEHTIETIDAVASARVHLVLPKESYFTAEEHAATASVVLKLRRASLPREQAASIRSLIAGAVENLHPEQVTLVDADGRSDLNGPTASGIARDQESALENKLIAMLEPLAGPGNVRATVNVTYDQGTEERTDEVYDPQNSATVSVQRTEQSANQSPRNATAAVGTQSNTPGAEKTPLPVNPQTNSGQSQTSREESSSYAVSRHLVHTQEGPGRVQRIAAAIVVNDREQVDGSGKGNTTWKPRSADEMRRLEQLAQAAVGYDTRRGDTVVVQNVAFSSNAPAAKPALMERVTDQAGSLLRSQPGLLRTVGMLACAVLLFLFVLRPMVKSVTTSLATGTSSTGTALSMTATVPELDSPAQAITPQRMFERVANHVRSEQQHSTRVLQSWIGSAEAD
ncbi:MAG: flagellar M-ring protein FliF [Acidobacteria bacterium]|nr:flagellar M-ring protein FliF [Acidobacteriota bacterium]